MAFMKFMHPRNVYRNRRDFKQIAEEFPDFKKYTFEDLNGKVRVDFSNPDVLSALTKTLLKKDFGIDIEIPPNHLIPTVPQRLNYILWIEDLMQILPSTGSNITGIDIGTGACCVYPLLGCKKNGWKFIATETDKDSVEWARKNVIKNNLQEMIEVLQVDNKIFLLDAVNSREEVLDFCVCNPPFFKDRSEATYELKNHRKYRQPPKGTNSANDSEQITNGGEVEFVKNLIADSKTLKDKVRIYTSLLGKKKSVSKVKNELRKLESVQFATTEFCQGNTMRWGIAWTYLTNIDLKQAYSIKHQKPQKPMMYVIPNEYDDIETTVKEGGTKIKAMLNELKISYEVDFESKNMLKLWLKTNENTWSNQRRKRRRLLRREQYQANTSDFKLNKDSSEISKEKNAVNLNESDEANSSFESNPGSLTKSEHSSSSYKSPSEKLLSLQITDSNTEEVCSKRKAEDTEERESKLLKFDDNEGNQELSQSICQSPLKADEKFLLYCNLELRKPDKNLTLKLQCHKNGSREPMHQVLQFFKNRIKW